MVKARDHIPGCLVIWPAPTHTWHTPTSFWKTSHCSNLWQYFLLWASIKQWCLSKGGVSSVQLLSHVWLFTIPWTATWKASLSITNSRSLLKHISIKSEMRSNHLILCHPLLLLPSIFPSIRVFSNESVLHIRWPKYWSFSISPSNECSELVSFRIDWLDLLAVQGTLKSLHQHHSSKASILQISLQSSSHILHDYWKNNSFD